ncbi:hypothetical protein F5B21DRAFT_35374 [Xylaria acuta]|nr:hypothetical protein F5B21DRAFT_35374 [Xylaria acuta]
MIAYMNEGFTMEKTEFNGSALGWVGLPRWVGGFRCCHIRFWSPLARAIVHNLLLDRILDALVSTDERPHFDVFLVKQSTNKILDPFYHIMVHLKVIRYYMQSVVNMLCSWTISSCVLYSAPLPLIGYIHTLHKLSTKPSIPLWPMDKIMISLFLP